MNVVFDLDGTLIDSFDRHSVVLFDAFKYCGVNEYAWFDEAQFRAFKREGNATKDYLKKYSGLTDKEISDVELFWRSHIEDEKYLNMDKLYEDTILCLKKLYEKHDIIYLTCRNNKIGLMDEVKRLDILSYAKDCCVVSSMDLDNNKKSYLKRLDRVDTIVVGDTEMDYDAATQNGLSSYILNRGFRSKEFWKKRLVFSHNNLYELNDYIKEK